jgi:signal transduction histidine kinase
MSKTSRKNRLRAASTFAAGVADDFNEILAVIMGYIELASLDMPVSNPARKNLDSAMSAINRAKDIVVDILSYSRQHELERTLIQISKVVDTCITSFKPSLPEKIKLVENIKQSESRVNANPSQIRQVFINLCTNASQAMLTSGGVLDITLDNIVIGDTHNYSTDDIIPGKYVMLKISDTGCGMDEDTMEKIFDPYFTTSDKGPGSGMGLALVDIIIDLCDGYIDVKSEPEKGSTFTVLLPEA